jgi:hypothetical protein
LNETAWHSHAQAYHNADVERARAEREAHRWFRLILAKKYQASADHHKSIMAQHERARNNIEAQWRAHSLQELGGGDSNPPVDPTPF